LKIAGISSKKLGDGFEGWLKNNNLYNDKELFDDADLNWYDYGFRNYDAQIGRFVQIDPLADNYGSLTPYHYAGNDPIANVDIDGLEGGSAVVQTFKTAGEASTAMNNFVNTTHDIGEVVVKSVKHVTTTAASVSKSFVNGLAKDLWSGLKGTVHAIVHIDQTVTGLARLSTFVGQVEAGIAIYNQAKNVKQEWANGDANVKAELIGAAVGEGLQLFGGEIAEVGKVGEVAKIAEVSGDVEKAGDLGIVYKMEGKLDKLGNSGKPYFGKADSEKLFELRQKAHIKENPNSELKFKIVDRAKPGKDLLKKEQSFIDAHGGPTNKSNPFGGTANRRNNFKKPKN